MKRCAWPGDDPLYVRYHDDEWGRPVTDDTRLFEKICLEGFQAGLSWITILRKRENFRQAFKEFAPAVVARFTAKDVQRLLTNEGIVRHRGKIESTINNVLVKMTTSLQSIAMSKDLKKRGWSFVGPTTSYAFMQAMGLVNDHIHDCGVRGDVEKARAWLTRPR